MAPKVFCGAVLEAEGQVVPRTGERGWAQPTIRNPAVAKCASNANTTRIRRSAISTKLSASTADSLWRSARSKYAHACSRSLAVDGRTFRRGTALSDRFQAVHDGMAQQTQGAQQIGEGMVQLNTGVKQVGTSVREFTAAAENLRQSAQGLQQEVGQFTVAG